MIKDEAAAKDVDVEKQAATVFPEVAAYLISVG